MVQQKPSKFRGSMGEQMRQLAAHVVKISDMVADKSIGHRFLPKNGLTLITTAQGRSKRQLLDQMKCVNDEVMKRFLRLKHHNKGNYNAFARRWGAGIMLERPKPKFRSPVGPA